MMKSVLIGTRETKATVVAWYCLPSAFEVTNFCSYALHGINFET